MRRAVVSLNSPPFSASWLRLYKSESPAQGLNDGDAAMGAGAAL